MSNMYTNKNSIAYGVSKVKLDQNKSDSISVSDALNIAKTGLETIKVKIIGEVSQVSIKPGYKAIYFTIKDKKSALPCLMWKYRYEKCGFDIQLGQLVEVIGRFSVYTAKGRMNFDCDQICPAGEGLLRLKIANLAKKLEAQGYTSSSIKKEIPKLPEKIGIVTSPRGAVIHDVLRTLKRRMPTCHVYFAGCVLEGKDAHKQISNAISLLDKKELDVILVCRGGGSFEDLLPFNDESVAMSIVNCKTPVVTGIGHEVDTTISDLVSDLRASTPTSAAESVSIDLNLTLTNYSKRLQNFKNSIKDRLNYIDTILKNYLRRPIFADKHVLFNDYYQTIDFNKTKLSQINSVMFNNYRNKLGVLAAKLEEKSPLKILSQGYCLVESDKGRLIRSIKDVNKNENVKITLHDGQLRAVIDKIL